jgi:hypothetical protein
MALAVGVTGLIRLLARDHVVIAGYGVNGQNLARALSSAGISYAIVEMNPETVRAARGRGEPRCCRRSCADCKRLGHASVRSCLHAEGARLNAGSTALYLWY